jgi:hypothetical protein
MPILYSSYKVGNAQIDGSCYVVETHTDSDGIVHKIEYLAQPDADYDSICKDRANSLNDELAASEIEKVLSD